MADNEIEFPHLPVFQLSPQPQETVDAVEFRGIQALDGLLVRIAGGIIVLDEVIAIRIDEFQIEQSQQFTVFQTGLVEKRFYIAYLVQPSGTRFSPYHLLTYDGLVRHQDKAFLVEGGSRVRADTEVFRGDLPIGGIVGRISAAQCAHQVPTLKVAFFERRSDFFSEQVERQGRRVPRRPQFFIGLWVDVLRVGSQLLGTCLGISQNLGEKVSLSLFLQPIGDIVTMHHPSVGIGRIHLGE